MPFEDFKRPWVVVESTVRCQPWQNVHISGEKDAVIIKCGDEYYAPGKYFDHNLESGEKEKIEQKEEYTIVFIEPKNGKDRIKAFFKGGQIGGSWIAEDNAGRNE